MADTDTLTAQQVAEAVRDHDRVAELEPQPVGAAPLLELRRESCVRSRDPRRDFVRPVAQREGGFEHGRILLEAHRLQSRAGPLERRQRAGPLVDALFGWLTGIRPKVSGGSGIANAVDYVLKREAALRRYLDDGRYPIDNNPVENAIRPIALGRKNWLFAGSETAGQRAAAIMSLIATAKANGIEPHAWLTDVLTRLPTTKDRDIATLLPLADYRFTAQGEVG